MNTTRRLASCVALLLAAGMGLAACGGGGGSGNGDGNGNNNGGSGNGADAGVTADSGSGSGNGNGTTNDAASTGGDGGSTGGGGFAVKEEFKSQGNQAKCGSSNAPDRCDNTGEKMASFDGWASASVLTELSLASDEAQSCCFDMDKREEQDDIDNDLGGLISQFNSQIEADKNIADAIKSGELVLVTEHVGLDDTQSDDDFKINFYLAEYAEEVSGDKPGHGTKVAIDSASFDQGTQPEAQVAPAAVAEGKVDGGPGLVSLNINIPSIGNLSLDVNGAKVTSNVNQNKSELGSDGKGVVLEDGKLGGYVRIKDVASTLNNVLSNCNCLGNPDPESNPVLKLKNTNPDDPDVCPESNPQCTEPLTCNSSITSKAGEAPKCDNSDNPICSNVTTVCGLGIGSIIRSQAKLDTDGDGYRDALSLGATFEMTGAQIVGIAPELLVTDQDVDQEVTVEELFYNEDFLLVIENTSDGSALGSKSLEAAQHTDVNVSLDQPLSEMDGVSSGDTTTLRAKLYTDENDNGSYDSGTDTAVENRRGNAVELEFAATVQ